jgi:membrane protease YdiL (CAAX protease family)
MAASDVGRSRSRLRLAELAAWAGLLVTAESTVHLAGIVASEAVYALCAVILLTAATRISGVAERRLAVAFAVVAIVRLMSMALPALILPTADWFALVGIPSLVAIAAGIRATGLTPADLGLRRSRFVDVAIPTIAGAGLGVPGYLILQPGPLVSSTAPFPLGTTLLSLFAFGALVEELLLRGLLQRTATDLFGGLGVVVSVAATTLLYAGSLDIRYVVFSALVGTLFGLEVRRTGSIVGVIAAHTALLWVQLVVLPAARG